MLMWSVAAMAMIFGLSADEANAVWGEMGKLPVPETPSDAAAYFLRSAAILGIDCAPVEGWNTTPDKAEAVTNG